MHRRLFILMLISILSTVASTTYVSEVDMVAAQNKPIPEYAKWGKLSMLETQKKYPDAQIKDYLHIGRETKNDGTTIERFKLWLKGKEIEFGVYITITFDTKTEVVKDIQFVETTK